MFNDKRGETSMLFSSRAVPRRRQPHFPVGTTPPQLGLPRVFVLTNPNTCSASESIINSLRGINVEVIRIGDTTCGKPYGFTEKQNCGYSFFAIEFQGFNAAGFGDYQGGFAPICRVAEAGVRGTATDAVLIRAALFYVDSSLVRSARRRVRRWRPRRP